MKLLICDGRQLEVFDVTGPIYRLKSAGVPIKAHGRRLVSEAKARRILEELRATGLYEGGRIENCTPKDD